MAKEAECPVCAAYIPLEQETRPGEHVVCSFCMAMLMVTREMLEDESDDEGMNVTRVKVEETWED